MTRGQLPAKKTNHDFCSQLEFRRRQDKIMDGFDVLNGHWYTLSGLRISKPHTKGVYIHNGIKVLFN